MPTLRATADPSKLVTHPGTRPSIHANRSFAPPCDAPPASSSVAEGGGAQRRTARFGGLSILGTTGIVVPYSCSARIHSIHRGVDVARAIGLAHVAGCTGSVSEAAVQALHALPAEAMIDMGDFAGGLLKYLHAHPVPRLTIGGGIGKISKLAELLASWDEISEVYSVSGSYDPVAIVRVAHNKDLATLVTEDLTKVDGIVHTETILAFRAYSRHDLEAMFAVGT